MENSSHEWSTVDCKSSIFGLPTGGPSGDLEPERGRPYDESSLTPKEQYVKERNHIEFVERWEELCRKWEEGKISSTKTFWFRWRIQLRCMLSALLSALSKNRSRQPMSDHFVSQLETMRATLEESQDYVPVRISQVADVLKSGRHLSRQRRHQMAETLSRVQTTLGRGFKKVSDGIITLLKAVKDGLLPEMKGYKALQENFAEFLQGISHLYVLHDLAVKAYSKGLISENAKNEVFATGIPLAAQANNFLGLIRTRIKRDSKAYDVFLDILRSEPAYEHLVSLAGGT